MSPRKRHSVAEVPLEVWRIIASFLSSQDVKNLYGINRPLFALAMEERYRSAYIGDLRDQQTINALQRLADQRRARYVRVLNFRPSPLVAILSLSGWKYWMRKSLKALAKHNTPFVTRRQTILKVIGNLSLVTSLTLECRPVEYLTSFKESLPFIAAGWASFGPNLQFLHVKIPLEAMRDGISAVKLPNLQGFVVDLSLVYPHTDGNQVILEMVIPFINNHADTLRYLGLHTWKPFNICKLLKEFVRIPMLDNLTLYQAANFEQTHLSELYSFLSTHARTLRILDLQFSYYSHIPYDAWFTTPCFRVALPELQSLVLKFWTLSDEHVQGAVNYVAQYSDTLAALVVTSVGFSYNQTDELATLFSAKGRLRNLALTAKILTPQLLVLLFNRLPFLEDLTLEFYGLAAQEGEVVTEDDAEKSKFSKEMGNVFIQEWKVRRLVLSSLKNLECKRAVAAALPNVRTFNGEDREVYLSEADVDWRWRL